MSRLDGNERWKSKMLLTEHQEQYQTRHQKPEGRIKPEELTMVRDLIMLPYMLTMSDRSLQEVQRSSNMYKRYFARFIQLMMDKISKDMFALRRELKSRNIKVVEDETMDGIIYHRYFCRGYEERFGIVRETMRTEIINRLARYADEIFKEP